MQTEEDSPNQLSQQNYDEADYAEYDEYNQGNDDYTYDDLQPPSNYDHKSQSSDNNAQYEMENLVKLIMHETQKVQELSGFTPEWALIYFESCGWKMSLVEKFIDVDNSSRKMINWAPDSQTQVLANVQAGECCMICCLEDKPLLKNMCGDEFCEECWKGHLTQRMRTYNIDPFPPCLSDDCPLRTSPLICDYLSSVDPKFSALYKRTLCRSFATSSSNVKICKGRDKLSCDKCFQVKKLFDVITCEGCWNLICGRCGEQYHNPSECYEGRNWKRVVENSTSFVELLDYRFCPSCKEAVERHSGCNSMICRCKQEFCYICGEKWLPNHSAHGQCYKEAEIRALNNEKKKKIENQKEYLDKLEKFKTEIEPFDDKIRVLNEAYESPRKIEELIDELVSVFKIFRNDFDYIIPLFQKVRLALQVRRNSVISLYFKEDQILRAQADNIGDVLQESYEFFASVLPSLILAFGSKQRINKKFEQKAFDYKKDIEDSKAFLEQLKVKMITSGKILQRYCEPK